MRRKVMQIALEALESDPISHAGVVSRKQAITALRQALETEPFEYWNAVEGWVKIDEVREHFNSVGCAEALRLADALDAESTQGRISNYNGRKAAVELRRLHEVNQDLLKALHEALETDLARVGEVGVWGECEPQEEVEDGWCNWVCPKPVGYLMQCCDCELIHEVDFRVVRYESEDSEVYEVVDDPNLQAQMRLRRRDDISPKKPHQEKQEPVALPCVYITSQKDGGNCYGDGTVYRGQRSKDSAVQTLWLRTRARGNT